MGERTDGPGASAVVLRDVMEADVQVFFEHQRDPDAVRMAGFTSRDRTSHLQHWTRILGDDSVVTKTIEVDGRVAGNVVSWEQDGKRLVGYWVGKDHWGRGVATAALSTFLRELATRPLHALVATDHLASIRVLEKCGFTFAGRTEHDGVAEFLMELYA